MTILESAIPNLVLLTSRAVDNDTRPGNKSPEQFATQGRYNYEPSFAAAVIFLILFGMALLANVVQFFWHRAWFWWVMIFAVVCESA